MLRKLLAAACFALLMTTPLHAQQALAIDTCGTLPQTLSLAFQHVLYMDKNGNLCTSGASSTSPMFTTSTDYTTTAPGTSAPLGVPVQGMFGGVPLASPDAGNYTGGSGSGTCAAACNATTLWSLDTSNYSEVSAQTTSAGTATVTIQKSNDNATWLTAQCYTTGAAGTGTTNTVVSTSAATGEITCPVTARYMRAQFTAYTSGTRTDFWVARRYQTIPIQTVFIGNGATAATTIPVSTSNDVPAGLTNLSSPASGTTGIVTSTLAGAASLVTRLCGLNVSFAGTGPVGPITITGATGGTHTIQWPETAATTKPLIVNFQPCLFASGTNTAIAVATTAAAGATAVNVNSWGFR